MNFIKQLSTHLENLVIWDATAKEKEELKIIAQ